MSNDRCSIFFFFCVLSSHVNDEHIAFKKGRGISRGLGGYSSAFRDECLKYPEISNIACTLSYTHSYELRSTTCTVMYERHTICILIKKKKKVRILRDAISLFKSPSQKTNDKKKRITETTVVLFLFVSFLL